MRNEEEKIFIVLIHLGGNIPTMERIRETAPRVKQAIEKLSKNNCQLVSASDSGNSFSYFLKTKLPSEVIRAELFGKTKSSEISPLLNDDSALILEVGSEYSGMGFSKAWTWLQHRQNGRG